MSNPFDTVTGADSTSASDNTTVTTTTTDNSTATTTPTTTADNSTSTTTTDDQSSTSVVDAAKNTGTEILVDTLDQILSPNTLENAEAGIAFVAALLDGWTFGAGKWIIDQISPGAGAELDRLREEHSGLSAAGDIASFLSPAIAAKIWVAVGRLGIKGLVGLFAKAGVKGTKAESDRALNSFIKHSQRVGSKNASKGVSKKVWHEVLTSGYGRELSANATKFLKSLVAKQKTDSAISKGLSFIKRLTGLEPVDAIQIWMAYRAVKRAYLNAGRSEQEAEEQALFAATVLAAGKLGRGITEQHIRRWLSKTNTAQQFSFLGKYLAEWGIPLVAINLGKVEDAAKATGEFFANAGGVVMPSMPKPKLMGGSTKIGGLLG